MNKEIADMDSKIKKKKEELSNLETMLINGGGPTEPTQEELDRIAYLEKKLAKYNKCLIKNYGEYEGDPGNRTTEIFDELDKKISKIKGKYQKFSDALDESEAELSKTKKRRKKRIADNEEILARQEKTNAKYLKSLKKLKAKRERNHESKVFVDKFMKKTKTTFNVKASFFADFSDLRKSFKKVTQMQKGSQEQINDTLQRSIESLRNKQNKEEKELEKTNKNLKEKIEELKRGIKEKELAKENAHKHAENEKKKKEEIDKINKEKENYFQKLKEMMAKWQMKMEIGDFEFTKLQFPKIDKSLQEIGEKTLKINNDFESKKEELAKPRKEAPKEVYQKTSFFTEKPPGVEEYIVKRKKVLNVCSDKAEIKYFLFGPDKLIEIFKRKRKQRNDTKDKKASEKERLEAQYKNQRNIQLKAINTRLGPSRKIKELPEF